VRAPAPVRRAVVVASGMLLPASLLAQPALQRGVAALSGVEARGLSFQSGLGITSVTEVAVPFGVAWTASPRLSFDLGGRYASASRRDSSGSTSISGLTDIQVRGVYELVRDVAVFTVAATLPTGTTKLTAAQLPVAGVIASDLLPFPVANFGSGFNVTTGLALAVPVGGWAVGIAGSYRQNGSYTPLADTSLSYQAGGEFRLRAGADRIVGQSRISLGFTFSTFGEDDFGNSPIFQSGKRYIGQASWSFPVGNVGLALYAWDLYRANGTLPIDGSPTDKRNVLALGGVASIQMGRNVLRPQIEYRAHTIGASNAGKLFSIGALLRMPFSDTFALLPVARFDAGNVVNPVTAAAVSFTGWDLGMTFRVGR
jgi:hypothetical protein